MKKNSIFALGLMALCTLVSCQPAATDNQETKSSTPKGMTLDEALHQRHSVRHYTDQTLTDEQILDLCWAGNGVSHAGNKRTAPSAVNAQDINIYVCKADGAYHYDALKHALVKVSEADVRPLLECQNNFIMQAPLALLLVSDQSNYVENFSEERQRVFAHLNAGMVSENISLYCTSVGLGTVCCAPPFNKENVREPWASTIRIGRFSIIQ